MATITKSKTKRSTARARRARRGASPHSPAATAADSSSAVQEGSKSPPRSPRPGGGGGDRGYAGEWGDLLRQPAAASHEPLSASAKSASSADGPAERFEHVPIDQIVPSDTNPREDFSSESLAHLAESIEHVGIVEPIIVRPVGKAESGKRKAGAEARYEIVAGERRYRAAKARGMLLVPCVIREYDDREAIEAQLVENLERADLNPIEEARAYHRLTAGVDDGQPLYTQESLAKRLGSSQPAIANRIRLLKLPEKWQEIVIRRQMPASHALELVPWADLPAVLKQLKWERDHDGDYPTLTDWRRYVYHATREAGLPIGRGATVWRSSKQGRVESHFTPSAEQEQELDVRALPTFGRGEKPDRMAFNSGAWGRMNKVAQLRAEEREKKKAESGKRKAAKKEPTPAERKAKAERDAALLARKVEDWRANWLRVLCAKKLDVQLTEPWLLTKLSLYWLLGRFSGCAGEVDAGDVLKSFGVKMRYGGFAEWSDLSQVFRGKLPEVAVEVLRRALVHPEHGPQRDMADENLDGLAADLGIDLAAEWTFVAVAGESFAGFLELHNREQLGKLAAEWKVETLPPTKVAAIERLVMAGRNQQTRLPKSVRGVKARDGAETRKKRKPRPR